MKLECGDIVFFSGKGWLSNIISKVTKGKVTHVGLMADPEYIFETHLCRNANFVPVRHYYKKNLYVFRPEGLTPQLQDKIEGLCDSYHNSLYSPIDIFSNLLFSWLPKKYRRKTVELISNKHFMICSELTGRIFYESNPTLFSMFSRFEGLTPMDIFNICIVNNERFKPILWNQSIKDLDNIPSTTS